MTTIDNVNFLFKRVKDTYTLLNKTTTPLIYSLKVVDCNNVETVIKFGTLQNINDVVTFSNLVDGSYKLYVDNNILYFPHYVGYRDKLITLIQKALCENCGCNTVNSIPKEAVDCIKNQSLFNFIQTYIHLIKPVNVGIELEFNDELFHFYQTTIHSNKCFTTDTLCKQLLETCIDGQSHTNKALFNYYISIYYLGLYYYDYYSLDSSVQDEIDYLNNVYHYKCISKCILNLGICIDDVANVYGSLHTTQAPTIGNTTITIEAIELVDNPSTPSIEEGLFFGYLFSGTEFTTYYNSQEHFPATDVIISSLPLVGTLVYTPSVGVYVPVNVNDVFTFAQLAHLSYSYVEADTSVTQLNSSFLFIVRDSAGVESNLGSIIFNLHHTIINLPPSQLTQIVKNGYGDSVVSILLSDFLADYIDPENDAPKEIMFPFVPASLSVPFSTNTVYLLSTLLTAGLDIYIIPTAADGAHVIPYHLSDVGSGQFNTTGTITINKLAITNPSVDAWVDQSLVNDTTTSTLNGVISSGSLTVVSILWTLSSITAGYPVPVIDDNTSAVTLLSGLVNGCTYVFTLTVIFNDSSTLSDSVTISVASGDYNALDYDNSDYNT